VIYGRNYILGRVVEAYLNEKKVVPLGEIGGRVMGGWLRNSLKEAYIPKIAVHISIGIYQRP